MSTGDETPTHTPAADRTAMPARDAGASLLLTRRRALLAAGVLPAAFVAASVVGCSTDAPSTGQPPGSTGTTPGTEPGAAAMGQREFVELSAVLTGVAVHRMDLAAATALNEAFADQSAALVRLKAALDAQPGAAARTIPADQVALARSLMTAWYTGMVGTTVATWTGALCWTVPHATAPGACGGFGTWAVPPANGGM